MGRDRKRGKMMTGAEKREKRQLAFRIAVLPIVMLMTLMEWVLEVLLVLNNWLIRPVAALSILSGVILMFQTQEDWLFILPALAFGTGLLFVAPVAQTLLRGISGLKKALIRAVY